MAETIARRPPRMLEVVEVARVHPWMQRVVLTGPDLDDFPSDRPGGHIKLFFPRDGQDAPILPKVGQSGPIWPSMKDRPIVRTYSLRDFDAKHRTIHVEFVLHEHGGPASRWAREAKPGAKIGLAGPGGPHPMLPRAEEVVLVGDLSAQPAMMGLIEHWGATRKGIALLSVPDERGMRTLGERSPNFELVWKVAQSGACPLVAWVQARTWDPQKTYVWVAGENRSVVVIRDHLRRSGYSKSSMYAVPYWKRDEPEEQYHAERHRIMDEFV